MDWNSYQTNIGIKLREFKYDPKLIDILAEAPINNKIIYTCGNGGSAAIAAHLSCDLNKGANYDWANNTNRYRSNCLNENASYMSAISNDCGLENCFSEQLKNHGKKGDILFAISSSGNSPNIVKAAEQANQMGLITIGLTGLKGGKLKDIVQYSGHVDTDLYEVAEDVHQIFCHYVIQHLRLDRYK